MRLPINGNFGPNLHCFCDMVTFWLKIAYFSYPSLIRRSRCLSSLWNFTLKLNEATYEKQHRLNVNDDKYQDMI